ncbi:MAG: 50S ribosomal protein L17 [Thermodesulfobacteriota bacterium]
MRHRKIGRRLGINTSARKAMLRNLAISLILNERIKTTLARAKELKRFSDRLVSFGKKGDLAARRLAASALNSKEAVQKLFNDLGPRFHERPGGYTRLVKMGWRAGDGATLCLVEFMPRPEEDAKGKSSRGGEKKPKKAKPKQGGAKADQGKARGPSS